MGLEGNAIHAMRRRVQPEDDTQAIRLYLALSLLTQ